MASWPVVVHIGQDRHIGLKNENYLIKRTITHIIDIHISHLSSLYIMYICCSVNVDLLAAASLMCVQYVCTL